MTFQTQNCTRRDAMRLVALALTATVASCATPPARVSNIPASDQTASALPLVNALRAKNGLPPLKIDTAASTAAVYQARRMADAGKMEHLIGIGDDFGKRVKASGVKLPAAENIAEGQRDVNAAVTAWINSPKHLHNMLGKYDGLGVALAYAPSSGGRPYWSMVLSSN
ncbi:CAP domain-containing protein [Rhizobium sp. SYY.PMSO]|uniref:CAP domain-containing protein n=1 Tax=Rhizobium sp. SYY.PMSO TaxID=3382192 RepID=UPI000DE0AE0D